MTTAFTIQKTGYGLDIVVSFWTGTEEREFCVKVGTEKNSQWIESSPGVLPADKMYYLEDALYIAKQIVSRSLTFEDFVLFCGSSDPAIHNLSADRPMEAFMVSLIRDGQLGVA